MRRKKLTDFMPLYSNAKTGSIVIDEPARDETPDLTTAELDKLAGDERPVLPELRTGDILKNRMGYLYRVYRVNSPKTGMWIEARYRLEKIDKIKIKGHSEFSLDELQEYGMVLYTENKEQEV